MGKVYATADIGSNTVHLLVAEFEGTNLNRIHNDSEWLSLGEIVSREGYIPSGSKTALIRTLTSYKQIAKASGAEGIYVFATEAMRAASNCDEVLAEISAKVSIKVDLINPRHEAELGVLGCACDVVLDDPWAMIEMGGGSVQVGLIADGELLEEESLKAGTGRLAYETGLESPATERQWADLLLYVDQVIEPLRYWRKPQMVVGAGGVARGLLRALHPDGNRTLAEEELSYLMWSAKNSAVATLCRRFSVKQQRAATFSSGALMFLKIMEIFEANRIMISEFGVREGAILFQSQGKISPCEL